MLVAIEGIDGAGKGTQANLLVQSLHTRGFSCNQIGFPRYGKTRAAAGITEYLNGGFGPMNSIPPRYCALLYAEDRFESQHLLMDMCHNHDVVVADRYVASNLAYQGARCPVPVRDAFIDWLAGVEYETNRMCRADLTLYLDIPVTISAALVARKGARTYTDMAADLHEQDLPYMHVCQQVYRSLCARQYGSRWIQINCTDREGKLRSKQSISRELVSVVFDAARSCAVHPGADPTV